VKKTKYKRKNYFIDKPFQAKFILKFSGIIFINAIIFLLALILIQKNQYNLLPGGAGVLISYDAFKSIPVKKIDDKTYKLNDEEPDSYIISGKQNTYNAFSLYWRVILFISLLNVVIILVFTLFFSHSMAGPIYRIKKTIRAVINGENVNDITLRKRDQFKELATVINKTVIQKQKTKN